MATSNCLEMVNATFKYQKSLASNFNSIGIRKFVFVIIAQLLNWENSFFWTVQKECMYRKISNILKFIVYVDYRLIYWVKLYIFCPLPVYK